MILPKELLKYSQDLYASNDRREVVSRNIARNSYYALYHEIDQMKLDLPDLSEIERKGAGVHEQLIRKLKKSSVEQYNKLGDKLASIKQIRTGADYRLNKSFSYGTAYKALIRVENVFKSLNESESVNQAR